MNVGFQPLNLFLLHKVVIKLLCMFASHHLFITLFFKFFVLKYVVLCVFFLPDEVRPM